MFVLFQVRTSSDVQIFGYSHPIFFANAEMFANAIRKRVYKSGEIPSINGFSKEIPIVKMTKENDIESVQQVLICVTEW